MKTLLTFILALCLLSQLPAQENYYLAMEKCKDASNYKRCMEGARIPNFKGVTIHGDTISTDDIKGKVAVIHFWFMYCHPCLAEMPGMNEVVDAYKDNDNVKFIPFTTDEMSSLEEQFFPKHEFQFEIIPGASDIIKKTFKGGWGFPCTIIVNKRGTIHKIFTGGHSETEIASKEIKEKLTRMINECL
jgi:peroxiredoxin